MYDRRQTLLCKYPQACTVRKSKRPSTSSFWTPCRKWSLLMENLLGMKKCTETVGKGRKQTGQLPAQFKSLRLSIGTKFPFSLPPRNFPQKTNTLFFLCKSLSSCRLPPGSWRRMPAQQQIPEILTPGATSDQINELHRASLTLPL